MSIDFSRLGEDGANVKSVAKKGLFLGIFIFILVLLSVVSGSLIEDVKSKEIVVIQMPFTGSLKVIKTPGWAWQGGGTATHYQKSKQYWFSNKSEEGEAHDQSIKILFNDAGDAKISGSIRYDMPLADKEVLGLHNRYGSQEAIEAQLIRPTLDKAVLMTGPLMSSRESFAEKKGDLLRFIEDQAVNGTYRTITRSTKEVDKVSGEERTVNQVEVLTDSAGIARRQEPSQIKPTGITLSQLSINDMGYGQRVSDQLQEQQKMTMAVQTSKAKTLQAEQNAITAKKEGEAASATAKAEAEVIKTKLVTEAEQKRDVAKLELEAAEFEKQTAIKQGEGEAAKRRLIMQADGALSQKLEAQKAIAASFADAIKNRAVPEVIIGGGSGHSDGDVNAMMQMFMANQARQMAAEQKAARK